MILAAGLGTRLRPLSDLLAKPAMPVRGIPVIAHTLALLARHDVREVIVNLHHLPDTVRAAVERHRPPRLEVRYSHEPELLGTGGGLKAVADYLRESDPSLVLAGDMLVDLDLRAAVARHRERGDRYTLLVAEDDPRAEQFGTLGFDAERRLTRIGPSLDVGGETARGLFLGIRVVAARSLRDFPAGARFEDLRDWLGPQLRAGCRDVRVDPIPSQQLLWQPVGTAEEYWQANFEPLPLPYRDEIPGEAEARLSRGGRVIVGKGARISRGASLERVVVWPGETIAGGVRARDGVYAGGRFVACGPDSPS
jgi:NDP-sugar pyrophosphorylase family protein